MKKKPTPKARELHAKLEALRFPSVSGEDVKNCRPANSETVCQNCHTNFSRNKLCSNLCGNFTGDYGSVILFTNRLKASVFCLSVVGVILICPKKNMAWIATLHVVALMTAKKSCRNVSIDNGKCDSVRGEVLISNNEITISSVRERAKPMPALVWISTIYIFEKSSNISRSKVDDATGNGYLNGSIFHVYSMLNVRAVSLLNTARRLTHFQHKLGLSQVITNDVKNQLDRIVKGEIAA